MPRSSWPLARPAPVPAPAARQDARPVSLGPGITRFRDPADRGRPLPPFPAYLVQPKELGPAPAKPGVHPRFFTRAGRRSILIRIDPGTSLYGTGEQPGPLLRNGTKRLIRTTDSFDYTEAFPALYQAHPWVMGVRADGSAFGVILETTFPCHVDLSRHIVFKLDARMHEPAHGSMPTPAVTIIERDSPDKVLAALAELTGTMPLPPKWCLGYQQSRWSYEPASRVLEVCRKFRERWMPCDVIWLDIDYMDGWRVFTFDKHKFPDPTGLNAELRKIGFKTVWMIDPGVKAEPGYSIHDSCMAGDHAVRTASGEVYQGKVWPGTCVFPDYTRARTREWWGELYRGFLDHRVDGVWNDMNEPAVFDTMWKMMPQDNRHDADQDLGGPGTHLRYRNIYGMQMIRGTREGIMRVRPDKRPFVLTRSNFLGGHRYAATWTGDNAATYQHMAWSINMVLNLGLSGQPFCGPDIGGFLGESTPELLARWMGIGALLPFARSHKIQGSTDHEPWAKGDQCEHVCRLALERRYRLMPYLYTLFEESSRTGVPIARPLFFAAPADPRFRAVQDAFLLGEALLVRCSLPARDGLHTPCASPMPPGTWRRFELTGETHEWLPELHLRAGSLIPAGPIMQFVDQIPADPISIYASLDEKGQATGWLYEDEGDGYGYQRGHFRRTQLLVQRAAGRLKIEEVSVEGSMPPRQRKLEIIEL